MTLANATTDTQSRYIKELEKLWDMLSDTIEGGRLTEADIPDDYQAFVTQMMACEASRFSQ